MAGLTTLAPLYTFLFVDIVDILLRVSDFQSKPSEAHELHYIFATLSQIGGPSVNGFNF